MERADIEGLVERQRAYYESGATKDIHARIRTLCKLRGLIIDNENEIVEALKIDLGKSETEAIMSEVSMVQKALSYMIRHTEKFATRQKVPTPLAHFPAQSYKESSAYGVVLVMSPWNYPFLLSLEPLISAIAAGNTVILKPSAYSKATTALLAKMLGEAFPSERIAVVTGGRAENTALLEAHFDKIFFTGSPQVGREVMRHAAEHLTPVVLELGGKSPCIVTRGCDVRLAARRIAFGKFLNCGQTCVAPDYIYCDAAVHDALVLALKEEIKRQYGDFPLTNKDYGHIISEKHFDRIVGLIDQCKVIYGGRSEREHLQITPTLMDDVNFEDSVMQEEIFGPVLPILTYTAVDEAVENIKKLPHPLALYVFCKDIALAENIMSRIGFGGGCINDTIIHLATDHMGFGGFGESGMGSYHGKDGFDAFTHYKSIVRRGTWLDVPVRYQPYTRMTKKLIRAIMK